MPKLIKRLLNRVRSRLYYTCQGRWSESNTDHPSEFDCEAENGGVI